MRLVLLVLLAQCEAVLDILTGLKMPRGLALDLKEGRMYWAEDGTKKLRSATLDGQDIRDVVVKTEVQEAPRDVAIDPASRKVYWTALCCGLRRADLDGDNEEVVASAEFASGVAIFDDYVYWADWMHGQILRRKMGDSGTEEPIVTGLASPVDVALDASSKMIYWSDVGQARTQRASVDGNGIQVLNMSWAIMNTYGMAVDHFARKLYMADFEKTGEFTGGSSDYAGRIIRTNLDGSNAEVLVSEPSMSMPYGVAVDTERDQVYWTDRKAGNIQRLSLKCAAGVQEVASRMNSSMVRVEHGPADHGSSILAQCPPGYNGSVTLACNNDHFTLNSGKCGKRCAAGSMQYELSGESPMVILDHPEMDDAEDLQAGCPSPMVGTVQYKCQDGEVLLRETDCRPARSCVAGEFLLGQALVKHSAMDHGIMEPSSCPDGFDGQYFLQCEDGEVVPRHNSSCLARCDVAGSLWVDDGAVEVSHGKIIEGGKVKVVCPTGSAGQGVYLSCENGYINVTESTCRRSSYCQGGTLQSGNAELSFDNLDDKENVLLQCPEGFTGSVDITCRKGEIQSEGVCLEDCAEGLAQIQGLSFEHDDIPNGQMVKLRCPGGYNGRMAFRCNDGNVTVCADCCPTCACVMVEEDVPPSELPVAALAAGVTALVLLMVFTMGVLRHRMMKRRAMAAAVAAAVGDILPVASTGLPKAGSGSGRSSTSAPTAAGSSGRSSRRIETDMFEIVVDLPMTVPLYWATRDGIHIFPDPNRIAEVQHLMNETWVQRYSRDRRLVGGSDKVPTSCRVANVLRVENHRAYARYNSYKDAVKIKRPGPCTRFKVETSNKINLLDDDINESYLFHGTNPESAQSIARDFFRVDRAGSSTGSMFGRGIYLAENASKSDEYAKEGSGVYLGLCAMLLCRCVMGEVLTVPEAADMEEPAKAKGYDSVCGDRLAAVGTFREMVFFNEEAVYPEFIVIYTRAFE